MTKTETKQTAARQKYDFINRVYEAVLRCIPAQTRECRKKVQVRITHQNYSRYIHFSAYGKKLAFQIYGDGNIAVELKEVFHDDHTEQLFAYDSNAGRQAAFLMKWEETASYLIRVFLELDVLDFHSYMDYVSEENNIAAAYQKMREEFSGQRYAE